MGEVAWGVLGCAGIAAKVCHALAEASNAKVVAVASRSAEKAAEFAAANAPGARAHGSYEALLADEEVQVVYIPLPTGLRADWVVKAAERKKHVLCEKPLAGDLASAQRMMDACQKAGVQFMDDTMFMHGKRLAEMKAALPDLGRVKHVASAFTIPFGNAEDWAQNNIRMKKDMEPLGCLGDLGWYCTRFTLWAYDFEMPEAVRCDYVDATEDGVPLQLLASMRFSGGRTAAFDASFKACLRQWAEVAGEKASLSLTDFVVGKSEASLEWSVTTGGISDKAITFPQEVSSKSVVGAAQAHTSLVEGMSRLVAEGKVDDWWPKVALQTQQLLVAFDASAQKDGEWVSPASVLP